MKIHSSLGVLTADGCELGASPPTIGLSEQRLQQEALALLRKEPVPKGLDIELSVLSSDW
jgi:hypothetical protein